MMPKALLLVTCLALSIPAVFPIASGAEPAALPDLSITPGDIRFSVFGEEIDYASQEFGYITIGATFRNAGPGASTAQNVTFLDNGRFLALVPAGGNLSASGTGNETHVEFMWYIADTPTGIHTIRVEASDPLGDADPSDNAAGVNITVYGEPPVIAVKFDTASKHAPVTATLPGIVTFTGSIVVDHPAGPVNVSLEASVDKGWPCNLNVTSLVMTDYHEHPFCVTVTVPPATKNSEVGILLVKARAEADLMSGTAETKAIIMVDPYFCLTASAARSRATAGPGENSIFEITFSNAGNSVDSYSINITNGADLKQKGWTFILNPASAGKVSPGAAKLLVVQVQPPVDWVPYKDEVTKITVKIASLNSRDFGPEVNATVSLTVGQKGFYLPSVCLTGLIVLLAVLVSAAVAYSLRRRKKKKTVADYNRELHLDD